MKIAMRRTSLKAQLRARLLDAIARGVPLGFIGRFKSARPCLNLHGKGAAGDFAWKFNRFQISH